MQKRVYSERLTSDKTHRINFKRRSEEDVVTCKDMRREEKGNSGHRRFYDILHIKIV